MQTSLEGINEIIQRIHGFQCPPNLRVCTKIGCLGTATPTRCARYPSWCVGFRCTGCAKSWNVCKVCSPVGKQLNRMTKNVDKNTHNKLHMKNENKRHINEEVHATRSKKKKKNENHIETSNPIEEGCCADSDDDHDETVTVAAEGDYDDETVTVAAEDDYDDEMVTVGAEEDDKKENNDVLISALKKMFPDENTASFFQHGTKNCGKSYIASCQLTKTDNPSVVSELDTELHLLLASLLLRITKGERYLLSQIMSRVVQKIVKDVTENSGLNEGDETARKTVKHLQIPLPSSENEFRQYLDGTTAIINKIPTPTIRVTADGD